MSEIKYVYWFAYYNEDSPSVRYRGKYPLDFLETNHGIQSTLIIPSYQFKLLFAFVKTYFEILFFRKKDSLIVVQRVHSNFIYATLLKLLVTLRNKNTVYDLDDADYLYCPPKSIYFFARKCSCIHAGSQAIADHLSQFNDNIVITSSPTPDLNIVKKAKSELFTIGWIGGFGGDHKKSLVELVFPAIQQLNFPCKLSLLGVTKTEDFDFIRHYFSENKHIQLEIPSDINWRDERALQEKIATFDVGIATLMDNEIQRSKSGIKAKQYLNNGVPVLGTNLPENDWVIQHGQNGYFCSNTADFYQRINEFHLMSAEEYAPFSIHARNSIVGFNLDAYFENFNLALAHRQTILVSETV